MEYGSESGAVWDMALRVELCGIWLCEWSCVEYGSESGAVWNMALRVEVSRILLIMVWKALGKYLHHFEIVVKGVTYSYYLLTSTQL